MIEKILAMMGVNPQQFMEAATQAKAQAEVIIKAFDAKLNEIRENQNALNDRISALHKTIGAIHDRLDEMQNIDHETITETPQLLLSAEINPEINRNGVEYHG